jgi:hypothetical protein
MGKVDSVTTDSENHMAVETVKPTNLMKTRLEV